MCRADETMVSFLVARSNGSRGSSLLPCYLGLAAVMSRVVSLGSASQLAQGTVPGNTQQLTGDPWAPTDTWVAPVMGIRKSTELPRLPANTTGGTSSSAPGTTALSCMSTTTHHHCTLHTLQKKIMTRIFSTTFQYELRISHWMEALHRRLLSFFLVEGYNAPNNRIMTLKILYTFWVTIHHHTLLQNKVWHVGILNDQC